MEENKKRKVNNWLIGIGLAILILFVVITSIVINYKQNEYNDIKDKNDQIEEQLPSGEGDNLEEAIFIKI